jgi:hypothetical protein
MTEKELQALKVIGYRAIVHSGTYSHLKDENGKAIAVMHEIATDCGHRHKTREAAIACFHKNLNYSKDRRACSATWYNGDVVPIYKGFESVNLVSSFLDPR